MAYNKHTWQSQEIISASKLNNIEDGVKQVDNLGALMAAYAVNMSNLEGAMQDLTDGPVAAAVADADAAESAAQSVEQSFAELETILDSIGLTRGSRINRPNLLKQNFWTTRDMPTDLSAVVPYTYSLIAEDATVLEQEGDYTFTVTDSRITEGFDFYWFSYVGATTTEIPKQLFTATFSEGSANVTLHYSRTVDGVTYTRTPHAACTIKIWFCVHADAQAPYGEPSRSYASSGPWINSIANGDYPGDAGQDGIAETVVDLAAADQITEPDGEVYTKAIQYGIQANTAYGNADWLIHNYSYDGDRTYDEGATEPKDYGNIEAMTPGKTYTLSCWARMTGANEKAEVSFAYGGKHGNSPLSTTTYSEISGLKSTPVEVSGTSWQRIHWTFVFDPGQNPQYTYTPGTRTELDPDTGDPVLDPDSGEPVTVNTITRTKNWTKRVQFGVHRKYTGTLQLCGFRLVEGGLYLPTKYDELEQRIAALEAQLEEAQTAISNLEGIVTENGGNES